MSSSLVHLVIAFLVLAGLVFLNVAGLLSPVIDAGRVSTGFLHRPLVGLFTALKNSLGVIFELRELVTQNQILTRQVEELSAQVATLEKTGFENKILREALGFRAESSLPLIAAEIIASNPLAASERVVINRGRDHGVGVGDAVVVAGGIFVGVIGEALEKTSTMELVTSSQVTINAETSQGGASGVVRGEHGLGLLFDLISQNEVLKSGDRVISSGLGGGFPRGLLLGNVGEIRSAPSELFQKASIIPATDLRSLRFVFVVK